MTVPEPGPRGRAPSQPLRIGVVGTGLIAGLTTQSMAAAIGCQPLAVSARRRDAAQAFATAHRLATAFADWRDLVASPDVDAIYVATPTAAREAICLQAARHGKHVLAEKPFASLPSLRAITTACREAGVAFMDATHFVHHPRTAILKAALAQRSGRVQAVRSSFFFPTSDRANVRFDPAQEPTGAIGDMAWYSLRAVAEFAAPGAVLAHASGYLQRDAATGAAVRGAGALQLTDGCTATWDVGYNCGACTMDLQLLGEHGVITLDDFVLDWAQGFMSPRDGTPAGFSWRAGVVNPDGFEWVPTPSARPQSVLMIERFVALAGDPRGAEVVASQLISERTQALLDGVWQSLRVS